MLPPFGQQHTLLWWRSSPRIQPGQQQSLVRPALAQRLGQLGRQIGREHRFLQIVQQAAQFLLRVFQRLTVIARPLRDQMPPSLLLRCQIQRLFLAIYD